MHTDFCLPITFISDYYLVSMSSVVIRCVKCLREACESALKEKHFLEFSQREGFVDDPTTAHSEQLEALEVVFNIAAEADTPTEVCPCLFFSLSSSNLL